MKPLYICFADAMWLKWECWRNVGARQRRIRSWESSSFSINNIVAAAHTITTHSPDQCQKPPNLALCVCLCSGWRDRGAARHVWTAILCEGGRFNLTMALSTATSSCFFFHLFWAHFTAGVCRRGLRCKTPSCIHEEANVCLCTWNSVFAKQIK